MHYRVWNESTIVSQQCVRVHLALQTLLRVVEKLTAYAGWRVAPHDSWVHYYNHYDSYCPYMILFQPVCCGADSTSLYNIAFGKHLNDSTWTKPLKERLW